jgi:hypothetical protein
VTTAADGGFVFDNGDIRWTCRLVSVEKATCLWSRLAQSGRDVWEVRHDLFKLPAGADAAADGRTSSAPPPPQTAVGPSLPPAGSAVPAQALLAGKFVGGLDLNCAQPGCNGGWLISFNGSTPPEVKWQYGTWAARYLSKGEPWDEKKMDVQEASPISFAPDGSFRFDASGGRSQFRNCRFTDPRQFSCDWANATTGKATVTLRKI